MSCSLKTVFELDLKQSQFYFVLWTCLSVMQFLRGVEPNPRIKAPVFTADPLHYPRTGEGQTFPRFGCCFQIGPPFFLVNTCGLFQGSPLLRYCLVASLSLLSPAWMWPVLRSCGHWQFVPICLYLGAHDYTIRLYLGVHEYTMLHFDVNVAHFWFIIQLLCFLFFWFFFGFGDIEKL